MDNHMRLSRTYKDAIAALNSLQLNFASVEAARLLKDYSPRARSILSIKEVYEFVRRLGYKPADFDKLNVIHVTGTKGKGLTCAFVELIVNQYRGGSISKVGLFTSPHLKSVRERIRINGVPINEAKFTRYFFEVWDKLSETESLASEFPTLQPSHEVKPMYFKYLTIMSFHVFMLEGVDTAIYEVGVGGKYDSTNIVEKPTVTAITSLGIDHTLMLGNTIEEIAWNKAGIYKAGVPALVAEQRDHPEAMPTVETVAEENGVAFLEVVAALGLPDDVVLGLSGDFQRQNAAVAVRAAHLHLEKMGFPPSELPDSEGNLPDKFLKGLEEVRWDGRCQVIRGRPENVAWFVDGAHTMELIEVASLWFKAQATRKCKVLLFNQQNRENAAALLARLHAVVTSARFKFDHVVFTTNITWLDGTYNPDLVSLNTLKEQVDRLVVQKEFAQEWDRLDKAMQLSTRKHMFPDIETSLKFIRSLGHDDDVDAFVCGSLHLVGGFLTVLDDAEAPRPLQ